MGRQPKNKETESQFVPEIRRARFGKLTIYEISEAELETLANGSPDSALLTFGVGLLTIAVTLTVSLFTTTIDSMKTFTVFVVAIAIGLVGGLLLMILWWRSRQPISCLVQTIRDRLPAEGSAPTVYVDETVVLNAPTEQNVFIRDSATDETE
jgi:hypothetical protein